MVSTHPVAMVYLKAVVICSKQWDNSCTLLLVPNVQVMRACLVANSYFLFVIPMQMWHLDSCVPLSYPCFISTEVLEKKPKEKYWQKGSSWPKHICDFTFRPFSSVLYFSSQPEISLLALFLSFAPYLKICSQKCCVFFIVVSCFLYARG